MIHYRKISQPKVHLCMLDNQYFIEHIPIQFEHEHILCGYRIINFISPTGTRRSFRVIWLDKKKSLKKGVSGYILRK